MSEIFLAAPFSVSFSQLPAVKKTPIFGAARKNFGPSYFVMALDPKWPTEYIYLIFSSLLG